MTSSQLEWKSNPIGKLHGIGGADTIPTLNDFLKFKDQVIRATGAVGIPWIWDLMETIRQRADEPIPQFLEYPGILVVQPGQADYTSVNFKTVCCAYAQFAGCRFPFPVPAPQEVQNLRNFEHLKAKLDSFGLQLSNAAS